MKKNKFRAINKIVIKHDSWGPYEDVVWKVQKCHNVLGINIWTTVKTFSLNHHSEDYELTSMLAMELLDILMEDLRNINI